MNRLVLLLACSVALSAATVRVQINGRITTLDLEQYAAAAVAGESSVFQSEEALKAMAVAARTYAVRFRGRHTSEGFDLCDSTHCQRIDQRNVTARIRAAVASTAGELLWYEGKPALTYYTRDCGGRSEDARAVWPDAAAPYLTSRADPYCVRHGDSHWHWESPGREIVSALERSDLRTPRTLDRISIAERTSSNRARTLLLVGGGASIPISASSFRFAIGRLLGWNTLRSERYEITQSGDRLVFNGTGAGHGVGLCQMGAEQMGLEKHTYREILAFYYPGTSVGLTAQGLRWQKLTGEHVALLSTQPAQDAATLALADRAAMEASQRTGRPIARGIEIRVYPDVDTFRNATGEPGWVAARTTGSRIDLQPATVLRARGELESTLRHELIHVLLEAGARPDLPVWFREGLAAALNAPGGGTGGPATETDLRQTADQSRARAANDAARHQVADLIRRYGRPKVLSWVAAGLPREVMNANVKQAPTKSK